MSTSESMLRLESIVGLATDPHIAERLHHVEHHGGAEYLLIDQVDTQRHRLRAITDKGTDCAIALPRDVHLSNGAVLLLEHARAVVVRMRETPWLILEARDGPAALQLGYFAGNMHWKVEFAELQLRIALEGDPQRYLERLALFFEDGRARRVDAS